MNSAGKMNVVNYDTIQQKIKDMAQEILFEVFCHKYTDAYVGTDLDMDKVDTITIEQVSKSLSFIKMQYCKKDTNALITTTPDTVYKKMLELVPILPDDATKRTFCLPTMYYQALTEQIRTEMQLENYVVPQPSLLPTKASQLASMSACGSAAVTALCKVQQVESSVSKIISNQIMGLTAASQNYFHSVGGCLFVLSRN